MGDPGLPVLLPDRVGPDYLLGLPSGGRGDEPGVRHHRNRTEQLGFTVDSDTPYGPLQLDLRDGPMVIDLPLGR